MALIDLINNCVNNEKLDLTKIYTIDEVGSIFSRTRSWVNKYKKDLEALGVQFRRKEDKPHKPHKPHKTHSHKGLPKNKVTRELITSAIDKEMFFNTHKKGVLAKYLVNKMYIAYGLVAPFLIEARDGVGDGLSKEALDILDSNLVLTKEDFLALPKELRQDDRYLDVHSDIRVYVDLLSKRHKYLVDMDVPKELRVVINRAFDNMFGFAPSEEQVQCVAKVIRWFKEGTEKSVNIQSDAGTSKTTTCLIIQSVLYDTNPLITAKTNKAISKIKHSKTINRLLNDLLHVNSVSDDYEHILHKASMIEEPLDLLIVDEASMVSERERRLLELICDKVLYVGDKKQLKPVKSDQGFNINYIHSLLTQYRFNEAEDDTQVLFTAYNKENRYLKCKDVLQSKVIGKYTKKLKDVRREDGTGTDRKAFYDDSFEEYRDLILSYKGDDSIVIAYANSAVDALNNILNDGMDVKVGSKVVLIKNDYETEQYNGFQYIVESIDESTGVAECVSMELGELYTLPIEDLVLGYALTTTKSQGSEWDHVLIVDGTSHVTERNRDRYVMVTRSSKSIRILADSEAVLEIGTIEGVLALLEGADEGDRNDALFDAAFDIVSVLSNTAKDIGLEDREIKDTINSAVKYIVKDSGERVERSPEASSGCLILEGLPLLANPRKELYYTPVFANGKTLLGKDQVLTYEAALAYPGRDCVAEQLKGGERIVIDCDSKSTVALFEKYINLTEAYISDELDSLHLVFTTDRITPTKHYKDLDLLGNKTLQLRKIKPNKKYNGKLAIPLTQEILDNVQIN